MYEDTLTTFSDTLLGHRCMDKEHFQDSDIVFSGILQNVAAAVSSLHVMTAAFVDGPQAVTRNTASSFVHVNVTQFEQTCISALM